MKKIQFKKPLSVLILLILTKRIHVVFPFTVPMLQQLRLNYLQYYGTLLCSPLVIQGAFYNN